MLRPRIIPCLLIRDGGLVKTLGFKKEKYVGDPINAVKIFNEKEADELMVLDIDATVKGHAPDFDLISKLAAECRMPLCYGGGITTAEQVARFVDIGVEKVAVSAAAVNNPEVLTPMAAAVGRQSVVAVMDIRKRSGVFSSGYEVCTHNASRVVKGDPFKIAMQLQEAGAGEIVINSVNLDGTMQGYDLKLAKLLREAVDIPITVLGGAGSVEDMTELVGVVGTAGAAAGSLFVFKGKYRAVLINYPTQSQKAAFWQNTL